MTLAHSNIRLHYLLFNLNFVLGELYSYIEYFEYAGIFFISLFAGIITVIPIPVVPFLALAAIEEQMNPQLVVLSGVAGSIAAKTIIFWCSYYGRNLLSMKTTARMLPLHKLITRYGWIAVIVSSATPIPDAPINIHLGVAKYNFWKFIIAAIAGKLIAYETIVVTVTILGKSFLNEGISMVGGIQLLVLGLTVTVIYVLILYLTFTMDWIKIIGNKRSDSKKDL